MKKISHCLLLLLIVLLSSDLACAAISSQLMQIVPDIYSGNHKSAEGKISTYISSNPNDPNGYILRGIANEWNQILTNKEKALDGEIMADFLKAQSLAEASLEKSPQDVTAKINVGNALMYVAKKQIDAGHRVQAGNSLKKSSQLMTEVLDQNPGLVDAYFAVGLYNFYAENVPSGFKWLAVLLGFKGDAAKGLKYLQLAASSPSLLQGDAQYMSVIIHKEQLKQYPKALTYAEYLLRKYPSNHVFLFDVAELQFRSKKIEESRENFSKFFKFCETNKGICSQRHEFLANYFVTWSYMDAEDYAGAKKYIDKAKALNTRKYKDRTEHIEKWSKQLESL